MALDKKFPADLFLSPGQRAKRKLEETLQSLKELGDKFSITTTLKLGKFSNHPKPEKPDLPTSFPVQVEVGEEKDARPKKSGLMGQSEEEESNAAARARRSLRQKNMHESRDTKKMHTPKKLKKPTRTKRNKRSVESRPRC